MKVLNKRYLNYLAYKQGHNMNSGNVYSVNAVFFFKSVNSRISLSGSVLEF